MAIVLKISCSGEEHTMTWDGEPTLCFKLYNGVTRGRPWEDLLQLFYYNGMLSKSDIYRLAVDFARRVVHGLEISKIEYGPYTPSDVIHELDLIMDGQGEEDTLKALVHHLSFGVEVLYLYQERQEDLASCLEELGDDEYLKHQVEADRLFVDSMGTETLRHAISCVRETDPEDVIDNAADTANESASTKAHGLHIPEGGNKAAFQKERLWQLEHMLKVIAAKQRGKPWPSV
jgi:hypothetical protein